MRPRLGEVPHQPGVYLMLDRLGSVIYVGKARDLRKRLGSYFMPSRRQQADLKTRALLDAIWNFEVHLVRNEQEALLLEGKLIKQYRPRYNVSFRDDKRFLLAKINPADPWPRFVLTRLRKDDGARYSGPSPIQVHCGERLHGLTGSLASEAAGAGSPEKRITSTAARMSSATAVPHASRR